MIKRALYMFKYLFLLLSLSSVANAANIYVANSGNDTTGDGSYTAPYATISKINSLTITAGDDVYFLCGDVWASEKLTVDWTGTSGDRVIIGAYHLVAGSPVSGCAAGETLPTFDENWPACCGTTEVTSADYYTGLIYVPSGSDYVTVENIKVSNTPKNGIQISGNYGIVQNVETNLTGGAGLRVYGAHNILTNNAVTGASYAKEHGLWPGSYPACVYVVGDHNVVKNSYIYDSWCEGIGFYKNTSNYNVATDNLIVGTSQAGVYIDKASNNVVQRNIILGSDDSTYFSNMIGIGINTEKTGTDENAINNLWRNNLIANVYTCFWAGQMSGVAVEKHVGGKFIGNTCVGSTQSVSGNATANRLETLTMYNNIFVQMATADSCVTTSDAGYVLDYNNWDTTQTDDSCPGANDVVTAATIAGSGWSTINSSNLKTVTDFAASGSIESTGVATTTVELVQANYPEFTFNDLTERSYDYNSELISSPYDIGALIVGGGTPAPATPETRPFKMEAGTEAQIIVGSGTFEAQQYLVNTAPGYAFTNTTTGDVLNTTDDELYYTVLGRNGNIRFDIPVDCSAGCDIKLHFVELYYGITSSTCTGAGSDRQFTIKAEGVAYASEFDICKQAGAAKTAYIYTVPNVINDGTTLTVTLEKSTVAVDGKPVIAAIEVIDAAGAGDTSLTVGTPTVTDETVNNYSAASTIDVLSICDVSSTDTASPPYLSALDTTLVTSVSKPTIDEGATLVLYTPDNSTDTGSQGSFIATIKDGDGVGGNVKTCTITINLSLPITGTISMKTFAFNGTSRVAMASQSNIRFWLLNLTDNTVVTGTGETTDADGVFSYSSSSITAGILYRVVLMVEGTSVIGTNTTYKRVYTREWVAN